MGSGRRLAGPLKGGRADRPVFSVLLAVVGWQVAFD